MINRVEPYDIWFYLTYLSKEINDPLIRCRIDFDGRIDEEALKRAITLSLETAPILGCCFDGRSNRPKWVNRGFTGEDMVRVVESGIDTESGIIRYFSAGIEVESEPLLKIYVLRKTQGDTLCVIISHIVCDGVGLKEYLYLLSGIYTELKSGREPREQFNYRRGIKPLFADIGLRERIRIQRSRGFVNAYSADGIRGQRGIDFIKGGDSAAYMLKRTLPKESFYKLKSFAKERNGTINDSLLALFARAFCKNTGMASIRLPATMNLRKFIPEGVKYGVSNYAAIFLCDIPVRADDTLAQTIALISEQTREHKSGKKVLKSVLDWNLIARLIPYPRLKKLYADIITHPIVSFTNFGITDSKLLNFDALPITETYITVSIKARPYLLLAVSTFNDCCTLSSNIHGSFSDKIYIDKLFDDIFAEVEALP
jgi:NRPS condensation-like uncharacterized protein